MMISLVDLPVLVFAFSLTDAAAHRKCARDSKSLSLDEGMCETLSSFSSSLTRLRSYQMEMSRLCGKRSRT